MTQDQPDQARADAASPLTFDVSFSFETSWNIAPAGKLVGFPSGGGSALRVVEIAPVHLAGLGDAEVAALVSRRASDMALLAKAIAAADIQFAEALQERTAPAG